MARERKVKPENLVVLRYSPNECEVIVRKLNPKKLPKDVAFVDVKEGIWIAKVNPKANDTRSHLRIGIDARCNEDDLVYSVIGIYDHTNNDHLTQMCEHAEKANEHTLLCERGCD